MSQGSAVRTEVEGQTLTVTLDRPKANAIDAATSRLLYDAFARLRDDPQLRVGIVTGSGDRFFSAGWDLKAAAAGEAADADFGQGGFAGLTEFHDIGKPVIAAVNGMAMGGGFELALAADLVVAAEHAVFALPEATLGLVADSGGLQRVPTRLPRAVAVELLLTGRRMEAAEAARWGLVAEIVPAQDLLKTARELAVRICASAPLSVAATLEVVRATEGQSVQDRFATMRAGLATYSRISSSHDAQEGPRAFVEGRPPRWQGN
ncbi:MAG: enoyl-CoA hydratase-related protein [Ornithinimicrobium sp.]